MFVSVLDPAPPVIVTVGYEIIPYAVVMLDALVIVGPKYIPKLLPAKLRFPVTATSAP